MKFDSPLVEGRLLRRYKRFLADIRLPDGQELTAHCANTGAMTGCAPTDARVWLSRSDNAKRKYPHSWQLVEVASGVLACINTALTNKLVAEALAEGNIAELAEYDVCQSEVRYGDERSRIDFLLSHSEQHQQHASPPAYVEVKHVTLSLQPGVGSFPDAVTKRGQKHLRELMQQVQQGYRAVLLFIIMRTDVTLVKPEDAIDRDYGQLLRQAVAQGVEVIAYATDISPQEIRLSHSIPVVL
jgi:sugar fermentation stimulation protein A